MALEGFVGKIERIWAQHNSVIQIIFEAGWAAAKRVKVPEGASWELHVLTSAEYPGVGPWSEAVTFKGDYEGGKILRHASAAGGGEFAWNIPDRMPATNIPLGSVTMFASQATRWELPEKEKW